ncbi:hypothetical protein [Oligella sp. MSHR50489EDL]|uniref:hypothetical protein n=1 Tax=Oligella sp. MSHR50489EDL TaxID=3139409 RepID=UPI003D8199F3
MAKPLYTLLQEGKDFPVIIHGALGDTLIMEQPKRVIAIGTGADDIAVEFAVIGRFNFTFFTN